MGLAGVRPGAPALLARMSACGGAEGNFDAQTRLAYDWQVSRNVFARAIGCQGAGYRARQLLLLGTASGSSFVRHLPGP